MNYIWKILEVEQNEVNLINAKYNIVLINENNLSVETEGYWWFNNKSKFNNEYSEQDIIDLIKNI